MNLWVSPKRADGDEIRLLPEQWRLLDQPRLAAGGVGTTVLHLVVVGAIVLLPAGTRAPEPPRSVAVRKFTPLIAPPFELTQKPRNRGRISKELDLEGLLPRPRVTLPPAPPATMRPAAPQPAPAPSAAVAAAQPTVPEPPKLDSSQGVPSFARAQPPQIQPEEKPKLAFERPGGLSSGVPQAAGRIPVPPRPSVEEALRSATKGTGGGIVVGDLGEGVGGLGEALNLPPSPGRSGSTLELLSDPMGVDFRPYLIRILSSVRRNWFAVIPESAKLGSRGRVLIQFAISRDGKVPKLVIALPSGAEALDRAAVAGISASNPFPPLPSEFRGDQVRLQFTFLYNMPAR